MPTISIESLFRVHLHRRAESTSSHLESRAISPSQVLGTTARSPEVSRGPSNVDYWRLEVLKDTRFLPVHPAPRPRCTIAARYMILIVKLGVTCTPLLSCCPRILHNESRQTHQPSDICMSRAGAHKRSVMLPARNHMRENEVVIIFYHISIRSPSRGFHS